MSYSLSPRDCCTPGSSVLHYLSSVCSNSRPLSQCCYLTISFSVTPFSFAFNLSQRHGLFQRIGSSYQVVKVLKLQFQHPALPMNIQDWFPLGLTGLIFLQSKQFSRIFSSATDLKALCSIHVHAIKCV